MEQWARRGGGPKHLYGSATYRRSGRDGSYNRTRLVRPSMRAYRQAILLLVSLTACAHDVTFVNVRDGTEITGIHRPWSQSIQLTLPSGEVCEGQYQTLTTKTIGEDSLFYRSHLGMLLGQNTVERFHGYARLTGEQGTLVEIVFSSGWTGRGFGLAKTSAGEEYRVTF